MPENNLVQEILHHHQGRDPERLALKYQAMRASSYAFLRGTAHLFYAHLPQTTLLEQMPPVWLCGDLHLENFGSFEGDNGLVYFDINDFDEAVMGPAGWDLARLLVSVFVAAGTIGINEAEAVALCHSYLDAYATALANGKAGWIERAIAQGMVKDLLHSVSDHPRTELLDKRTELSGKERRLKADGKKALPASEEQRQRIDSLLQQFAAQQPNPDFFKLLDVARRIAGTGSLGVERYIVLVEGGGSPDANILIDLKQALPPTLQPAMPQPAWPNQAARIIAIQQRMQAVSPALLHSIALDEHWYVMKELQPSQDRIDLGQWQGKLGRLEKVLANMGELTAWAELRSSGRQQSAIADTLVAFGEDTSWRFPMIEFALEYSRVIAAQWAEYCDAFDAGLLAVPEAAPAASPARSKKT